MWSERSAKLRTRHSSGDGNAVSALLRNTATNQHRNYLKLCLAFQRLGHCSDDDLLLGAHPASRLRLGKRHLPGNLGRYKMTLQNETTTNPYVHVHVHVHTSRTLRYVVRTCTCTGWSWQCFASWGEFARVTSFSVIMTFVLWICTEVGTFFGGMLGTRELSAFSMSFQVEGFAWMVSEAKKYERNTHSFHSLVQWISGASGHRERVRGSHWAVPRRKPASTCENGS